MTIIGITGPTGAGKTTALRALEALGAELVDADQVYHCLLDQNPEMKSALVSAFGENILDKRGKIDRRRLSRAVYPDRLEQLNALTHPHVVSAVDFQIQRARGEGCPILAIDAIALVESGLADRCDTVVAVLAPLELRLSRIMARDGIDRAYARRRALAQKPDDFFRIHSDYVLENRPEDTPDQFQERALELFRDILTQG